MGLRQGLACGGQPSLAVHKAGYLRLAHYVQLCRVEAQPTWLGVGVGFWFGLGLGLGVRVAP